VALNHKFEMNVPTNFRSAEVPIGLANRYPTPAINGTAMPSDEKSGMKPRGLPCLSFFTGGGGLDLGLEASGFETRFATDIDRYSCATLQLGRIESEMRGLPFLQQSVILSTDAKTLDGDFVLEASRLKRGEVGLMSGGPPCQAFSIFGQRKGTADHRGQLVFEYVRLLSQIAPEAFLFENVFGLLTVQNGEVFKTACERLRQPRSGLRYELSVIRLNAVDYGVPQYRDRIFIIGTRNGKKISSIDALTVAPGSFKHTGQVDYRTVEDALRGLPLPNEKFPANHTGRDHSDRIINRYASMSAGERDSFTRINKLDVKNPSFTIIVGSDQGGGKGHIHPIMPREVTPRESARIQTFPDWWSFTGTVRHPIRQVGNAVPPLLSFAVGNAVREQIFGISSVPVKTAIRQLSQTHLFPEWFDQQNQ
jgi:DNA (cytosine-5)-methyltransferase 1